MLRAGQCIWFVSECLTLVSCSRPHESASDVDAATDTTDVVYCVGEPGPCFCLPKDGAAACRVDGAAGGDCTCRAGAEGAPGDDTDDAPEAELTDATGAESASEPFVGTWTLSGTERFVCSTESAQAAPIAAAVTFSRGVRSDRRRRGRLALQRGPGLFARDVRERRSRPARLRSPNVRACRSTRRPRVHGRASAALWRIARPHRDLHRCHGVPVSGARHPHALTSLGDKNPGRPPDLVRSRIRLPLTTLRGDQATVSNVAPPPPSQGRVRLPDGSFEIACVWRGGRSPAFEVRKMKFHRTFLRDNCSLPWCGAAQAATEASAGD
jgi:hypothetical protein